MLTNLILLIYSIDNPVIHEAKDISGMSIDFFKLGQTKCINERKSINENSFFIYQNLIRNSTETCIWSSINNQNMFLEKLL